MKTVAALYVDHNGPYMKMVNVDAWDETRDATTYQGPYPVVAHPPCGPWGRLKGFCRLQNKCLAPIAVNQVRRFGGILEHPKDSSLWIFCRLPKPGWFPDSFGGFTVEIEQVRWGHRAEKKTWLYMVGINPNDVILPPPKIPTGMISCSKKRRNDLIKLGSLEARLTPPDLAHWLVDLAATTRR